MHERLHCHDEAAGHQVPIAAALWITQIVPTMLKLNAKFDADLLFYSVILNVMTTQVHSTVSTAPTD